MHTLKPAPLLPQRVTNLCPICGQPSYSRDGIHPQCAVQKADEPRNARLRAARASAPKVVKPRQRSWNKKCPKCSSEVHVRLNVCHCGHKFISR